MLPLIQLGHLRIYSFGICIALALASAFFLGNAFFQRRGLGSPAARILLFAGPVGLIAAHFNVRSLILWKAWLHPLSLWGNCGLTYLSGVSVGVFVGIAVVVCMHLPLRQSLDAIICVAPAYAIGRLGCFLAGDGDYGPPTSLPWGVAFPHGLVPTAERVHPTMLYIAFWEIACFAVLWHFSDPKRRRLLPPGMFFGAYLVTTSVGRITFEFLSRNPKVALGFTEAQWVSGILFFMGSRVLLYLSMSAQKLEPHEAKQLMHFEKRVNFQA